MTTPADRLGAALDDLGTPAGSVPARRAAAALASLGEAPGPARRPLWRHALGRLRRTLSKRRRQRA